MSRDLEAHEIPYEEFEDFSEFYESINSINDMNANFLAEIEGGSAPVADVPEEKHGLREEDVHELANDILGDLKKKKL